MSNPNPTPEWGGHVVPRTMKDHIYQVTDELNEALAAPMSVDDRAVERLVVAGSEAAEMLYNLISRIEEADARAVGVQKLLDEKTAEVETYKSQIAAKTATIGVMQTDVEAVERKLDWYGELQRYMVASTTEIRNIAWKVLTDHDELTALEMYQTWEEVHHMASGSPDTAQRGAREYAHISDRRVVQWLIDHWPLEPVSGRIARATVKTWLEDQMSVMGAVV